MWPVTEDKLTKGYSLVVNMIVIELLAVKFGLSYLMAVYLQSLVRFRKHFPHQKVFVFYIDKQEIIQF